MDFGDREMVCYNEINPSGGMIFLNNHVLGISWHCLRGGDA